MSQNYCWAIDDESNSITYYVSFEGLEFVSIYLLDSSQHTSMPVKKLAFLSVFPKRTTTFVPKRTAALRSLICRDVVERRLSMLFTFQKVGRVGLSF